jgi:hypothetical protein
MQNLPDVSRVGSATSFSQADLLTSTSSAVKPSGTDTRPGIYHT